MDTLTYFKYYLPDDIMPRPSIVNSFKFSTSHNFYRGSQIQPKHKFDQNQYNRKQKDPNG